MGTPQHGFRDLFVKGQTPILRHNLGTAAQAGLTISLEEDSFEQRRK